MLEALKNDPRLDHVEEGKVARGYTVYMRLPRRETELPITFEEKVLESTWGCPSVVYLRQRREVEILLTGYSIPLRAKVIDRLHELENRPTRPRVFPATSLKPSVSPPIWRTRRKPCAFRTKP